MEADSAGEKPSVAGDALPCKRLKEMHSVDAEEGTPAGEGRVGNPQPLPCDGGAPLPFSTDFRVGVLDNGLRWYFRRNSEPRRRAELRLVVGVGSISETEQERGIAHMIEHLAFRATAKYPRKQDVVSYLESIGAQFGPCQNAYTRYVGIVLGLVA